MLTRLMLPLLATCIALMACTPIINGSNKAAQDTKQAIYDTKKSWSDLFVYHPEPKTPQTPQTRYCYGTQSDVVCYDSPQEHTTSKLVGYQDGANISWFQPGGGALGASGGEPTASYHTTSVQNAPPMATVVTSGNEIDTSPAVGNGDACSAVGGTKPFYCNESPYVQGAVSTKDNPPPR